MTTHYYETRHIESKGTHPESGEPYTIFIIKRPDTSHRMNCGSVYECYLSQIDYPLEYMFGIPEKDGLLFTLALAHEHITDYWQEG